MMNMQLILPGSAVNVAGTQVTLLPVVVNVMEVRYLVLIVRMDDNA